jgi:tripartite-type tricarboxylate transporter receptor subunit TctC
MKGFSVRCAGIILAVATFASVVRVFAGAYPDRPVELVVPFAAGGASDVIGRIVAKAVSAQWEQPIVVVDKPGATGAIASEYVAHAAPDGYTLLAASASTHTMLPAFRNDLPYDTISSFEPVTLLAAYPNMLVVNPKKVPATNVAELIDLLKKNPGKYTCASSGVGGSSHFACELFKLQTKTEMTHVPYKGSGPAMADLIAANVDLTFDNMSNVWPQVLQGQLRALGVCSLERSPFAPNVPAIAETVPGFEVTSWLGIVAPAQTPKSVVETLAAKFHAAISNPAVQKQLADLGATAMTDTSVEFAAFIQRDLRKWQDVANKAHIHETQ